MSLLDARPVYKPFKYPWAYDAWLQQQEYIGCQRKFLLQMSQLNHKLNKQEKNLLSQIFDSSSV